jgi:Domain of unknown function (DUF4350)
MKGRIPIIASVVCAVIFAAGLFQLLKLRFEAGDVYPPYSSLRADPLGTMAFYEALERMREMKVERDFSAGNKLPEGRNTTYLHLGARTREWQWMDVDEFRTVEDFVTAGGRLVITFFPEVNSSVMIFRPDEEEDRDKPAKKEADKKSSPSKSKKKRSARSKSDRIRDRNSTKERWGIDVAFRALEPSTNKYESTWVERRADLRLPEELEWHSGVIFTNLSTNWHTIYARGTNAVLVERKMGAGTVVMAGDSFFISNQAMVNDRHPELLSWFVGPSHDVVFDEAHFGVLQTEGVATLLRKYHLYAVVGALVLLAILFIWANAFSFVPPWQMIRAQQFVAGRETSAGFVNLLRRNIPSRDLLKVCFGEWKKSVSKPGGPVSARHAQAEALVKTEMERRHPLDLYQEICRTLKKL